MSSFSSLGDWMARMKHDPFWSICSQSACSIIAGAAFGAALTAAGVHLPETIVDQFRLTDFRMFQVFTIALGSSVFIILGLDKLNIVQRQVQPTTSLGWFSQFDGNILGGILVGLGMSMSGSCPGTVTAQLAQGVPTAGITALGGLLGGIAHIWLTHQAKHDRSVSRSPQLAPPPTIPKAIGVSDKTAYTVVGISWLSLLYFSTVQLSGPMWQSAAAGGLYLGMAQLISLLTASSTLGSTGMYDQAGRFAMRLAGSDVEPAATPPRSLLFGIGAVAGSWALTQAVPAFALTSVAQLSPISAFAGGFCMAFGAKVAKGCTSGHGLSGMGALSLSSLVSVASMFGTGILSQHI